MSIDEFLKQLKILKRRADVLLEKYNQAESEAESPPAINYYGMPHSSTKADGTENRYIKIISAGEEWKAARQEYLKYYEMFEAAMYKLFYWEGLIINQVYIINTAFNYDQLKGLSDILKTKDRREILAKLETAKEHLKRILNENGMKIE